MRFDDAKALQSDFSALAITACHCMCHLESGLRQRLHRVVLLLVEFFSLCSGKLAIQALNSRKVNSVETITLLVLQGSSTEKEWKSQTHVIGLLLSTA